MGSIWVKSEKQCFCGKTYECVPQMCANMACSRDFMWLKITGSLKVEGKHVRRGSRWAPGEVGGA